MAGLPNTGRPAGWGAVTPATPIIRYSVLGGSAGILRTRQAEPSGMGGLLTRGNETSGRSTGRIVLS